MSERNRIELSNDDLVTHLASLCLDDAQLKAEIVTYLIEVERRRLHLRMAYKSMSDFCIRLLRMSPYVAFHRTTAARIASRHPCVLPAIARGEIHLSTLVLLRDHLTATNAEELLAEVRGMSVRQVETMLAERAPKPDIPSRIDAIAQQAAFPLATGARAPAERIAPIAPQRFAMELTVSQEFRDKLERAKEMMRHRNPDGSLEVILERALDALLAKLEKELRGKSARPRDRRGAKRGAITRDARREVFERDGEQCVYEDGRGNRCPARGFLELDHIESRALGGTGDTSNLRVLCRAHNRLHAEDVYGREHMDRSIGHRSSKVTPVLHDEPATETMNAKQSTDVERSMCTVDDEAHEDGRAQVLRGLVGLGFRQREAVRALDGVLKRHGPVLASHDLPDVLREAIRLLT